MDGQAGRVLRQMQGRIGQAARALDEAAAPLCPRLGVAFGGQPCPRPWLLRLAAGRIALGAARWLEHPELLLPRDGRVAVSGPNGAGKSTLIREVVCAIDLPEQRVVYLPQEVDVRQGREVVMRIRSLDRDQRGRVLSHLSRLGSDARRVLKTASPSPGELRKLLLALGMLSAPHLLVLDEPTNHLDVQSIECLEDALRATDCALLLVSHDERFLSSLATARWRIECSQDGGSTLTVSRRNYE